MKTNPTPLKIIPETIENQVNKPVFHIKSKWRDQFVRHHENNRLQEHWVDITD